jgi:hypothetical protein
MQRSVTFSLSPSPSFLFKFLSYRLSFRPTSLFSLFRPFRGPWPCPPRDVGRAWGSVGWKSPRLARLAVTALRSERAERPGHVTAATRAHGGRDGSSGRGHSRPIYIPSAAARGHAPPPLAAIPAPLRAIRGARPTVQELSCTCTPHPHARSQPLLAPSRAANAAASRAALASSC